MNPVETRLPSRFKGGLIRALLLTAMGSWCLATLAQVPAAPGNVTASWDLPNRVEITWNSAPLATSYEVWRGTNRDPASAVLVQGSIVGERRFNDTGWPPGAVLNYWVRAQNGAGNSEFSNSAEGRRRAANRGDVLWDAPRTALATFNNGWITDGAGVYGRDGRGLVQSSAPDWDHPTLARPVVTHDGGLWVARRTNLYFFTPESLQAGPVFRFQSPSLTNFLAAPARSLLLAKGGVLVCQDTNGLIRAYDRSGARLWSQKYEPELKLVGLPDGRFVGFASKGQQAVGRLLEADGSSAGELDLATWFESLPDNDYAVRPTSIGLIYLIKRDAVVAVQAVGGLQMVWRVELPYRNTPAAVAPAEPESAVVDAAGRLILRGWLGTVILIGSDGTMVPHEQAHFGLPNRKFCRPVAALADGRVLVIGWEGSKPAVLGMIDPLGTLPPETLTELPTGDFPEQPGVGFTPFNDLLFSGFMIQGPIFPADSWAVPGGDSRNTGRLKAARSLRIARGGTGTGNVLMMESGKGEEQFLQRSTDLRQWGPAEGFLEGAEPVRLDVGTTQPEEFYRLIPR